jgi:hypothetical protein
MSKLIPEYSVMAMTEAGDRVPEMSKQFATFKTALAYYQGRTAEYTDGTNNLIWALQCRPVTAPEPELIEQRIARQLRQFNEAFDKAEKVRRSNVKRLSETIVEEKKSKRRSKK